MERMNGVSLGASTIAEREPEGNRRGEIDRQTSRLEQNIDLLEVACGQLAEKLTPVTASLVKGSGDKGAVPREGMTTSLGERISNVNSRMQQLADALIELRTRVEL